jgi:exo-beta-1,3-glucanase (GH17 family)/cellulose synthase/poly-beta-1,6-N-acetylglucosamine synthase-like glycosyltransferase
MKSLLQSLTGLLLIAAINFSVWAWLNRPQDPAVDWYGMFTGLCFSPMHHASDIGQTRSDINPEIETDLAFLSGKTVAIRTYGTSDGLDRIPEFAARHKLNVTAGAWINQDLQNNEEELQRLIRMGRDYRNTVRLLVGNEALLRKDISVEQLIDYIHRVQDQVGHRVSTAEPWHVWLRHPELAHSVDFIAVHILPYWEGVDVDDAVDYLFQRYAELQHAYPGKPIILAEVGWPSAGPTIGKAVASPVNQAKFLRRFLNAVDKTDMVYYIVEAFDQPWKLATEGTAGAYWGIYNAERQPKFTMAGAFLSMPTWKQWAFVAGMLALLPALFFIFKRQQVRMGGKVMFALVTNFSASGIAWSISIGATHYQTSLSAAVWIALVMMQLLALVVLLAESVEVAEILWRSNPARDFKPLAHRPDYAYPKVSVHLPIHNEPPELVRETLLALARLDYPEYEILVIDNNTKDPAVWQPVEALCCELGARFRFFHLDNWPGYKAGALNFGLRQTAEDAGIVAVIDSDYVVSPQWLKSLTPYFDNPQIGFVQAPQDYRDGSENLFKRMCYWEYAGFFHIGMVQRNDFNAIIQHGTMTMIRKTALVEVGRWGEWCITEDAELGLRLFNKGYNSVYVAESLGRGVMPDTLSAYKTQRFRWAYGAVQIMKKHFINLLPFVRSGLSPAQKYYFISGWLPWFSDSLALVFVLASLALTTQVIVSDAPVELPVAAFLFPTLGIFSFKIIRSLWLYLARVRCGILNAIGAALAGLALMHTVGKAILTGFTTSGRPFVRTPKLEHGRPLHSALAMAWEELILLIMLWGAAGSIGAMEQFQNAQGRLWISVLLVQSVPYLATVVMAIVNVIYSLERNKPVSSQLQTSASGG